MTSSSLEVLYIDPRVPDIDSILTGLRPGVEAVLLDTVRPAAAQMADALADRSGLAAIHVMAHGAPGRVDFTAGEWSAATLARDASDLAAIGAALADEGHLMLWSCEVGRDGAGEAFVKALKSATGAYVAAADRKIGASALGGAWALNVGTIARPPLTEGGVAAYAGVLAGYELTVSGPIPQGTTTSNVSYFVVDRSTNAIAGNITLPNAATFASSFRLEVTVPEASGSFDVGLFDEAGRFVSAGFAVEAPTRPTVAVGPKG